MEIRRNNLGTRQSVSGVVVTVFSCIVHAIVILLFLILMFFGEFFNNTFFTIFFMTASLWAWAAFLIYHGTVRDYFREEERSFIANISESMPILLLINFICISAKSSWIIRGTEILALMVFATVFVVKIVLAANKNRSSRLAYDCSGCNSWKEA